MCEQCHVTVIEATRYWVDAWLTSGPTGYVEHPIPGGCYPEHCTLCRAMNALAALDACRADRETLAKEMYEAVNGAKVGTPWSPFGWQGCDWIFKNIYYACADVALRHLNTPHA